MASNDNYEEKPNLRPTKRVTAGGKSVFLHYNPYEPSNKSYIHAVWRDTNDNSSKKQDPFGIDEPHIEYSLNKQQRWEVLNNFREHINNQSSPSSDDELATQSDSEQQQQKKKKIRRTRRDLNTHQTKYRLYEYHDIDQQADCVSITSNTGQQLPSKTYMKGPSYARTSILHEENLIGDNDNRQEANTADVTYYAVVPPPKEKHLSNIRKQHSTKDRVSKKSAASIQRKKLTHAKERMNAVEQLEGVRDETSTDEEELMASIYSPLPQPGHLQLNDFIPIATIDDNTQASLITENLVTITKFDPKSSRIYPDDNSISKKFHRQISREEKLYNRDKAVYLQMQKNHGEKNQLTEKSHHHLMSLSFRSIFIDKTDLTIEYLSKTYGKNFLQAQCHPTKYLICLTNRLKSYHWSNKFDLFPTYSTLNSYLIILLNDETSNQENFQRIQVALNMDLYADTIEIENLYESTESVYRISDLIERTIEFIATLPFDTFKPIDSELNRKKLLQNEQDNDLSESEFLNKQIRHLQLLDKNSTQTKTILEEEQLNNEVSMDEYALIKPDICTSCYQDMTETIPMTALKACGHWLCNDCWRQYLENSIKQIKVVLCPEWNCCSIVDVGTILSLVNVRCMNIYERNIEKCLVNLSRSYVKCSSKSCSNIVKVIGPGIDHVRCRCGHQFCINCKQEPHFPATCSAYRLYMDEVFRNGDLISDYNAITQVKGRKCVSCDNFIEKNGGCNHMTCRCGAEFCWTCTGYWKDHNAPDGTFRCPREAVPLEEEVLAKQHNQSRRYYYNAIFHRHERVLQMQPKQNENVKRLLGTIPLEKGSLFNSTLIKSQIDKRESLLRHLLEMVKYIGYLHRICEFIAVSADGYGNNPSEFRNSLQSFETIVFNMSQIIEGGKGYKAIEQIKQLHTTSEKLIERLRRAVTIRELRRRNTTGYVTS